MRRDQPHCLPPDNLGRRLSTGHGRIRHSHDPTYDGRSGSQPRLVVVRGQTNRKTRLVGVQPPTIRNPQPFATHNHSQPTTIRNPQPFATPNHSQPPTIRKTRLVGLEARSKAKHDSLGSRPDQRQNTTRWARAYSADRINQSGQPLVKHDSLGSKDQPLVKHDSLGSNPQPFAKHDSLGSNPQPFAKHDSLGSSIQR